MTEVEMAKLMGRSDAIETVYEMQKFSQRFATEQFSYHQIQKEVQRVLHSTMKIVQPSYASFFSHPENRIAYYSVLERELQQVGLLQGVPKTEAREAVPH